MLRLEQQIDEKTHKIIETIQRLFYRTQMLATIIIHDKGSMEGFEIIAPSIVDDPVIQSILLAPDGIVEKVYPYAENRELIGRNYFDDMEAFYSLFTNGIALGGPMEIIQGGNAIFGRQPVFIDTPDEKQKFWGIVSIALKFPRVLDYAELNVFDTRYSSYELWKINPDTDEKQIIASGSNPIKPGSHYIEKPIHINNADWFLKVSFVEKWYDKMENVALILVSLFISLIVLFVMQNNYHLKHVHNVLRLLADTDPLTKIFNRRHFMEIVNIYLKKAQRMKEKSFFIMFDIDNFKIINDKYGHQTGDMVLIDVTERIKSNIRSYDLFARYGGEEFIIFTAGSSCEEVCEVAERLRLSLCETKYTYDDVSFDCSASFGVAKIEDDDLDFAMRHVDKALYAAKRNGRNCVVYYDEAMFSD